MPLARLSVPSHLPAHRVRALADAVHDALVATCGVPQADRFQLVVRLEPEAMILDPVFPGVARSGDASVVEISFLGGRSPAQKRALYREAVARAVQGGFRPDDVMIALVENSAIDWSLGRGLAYADA